jgi:hypothetical protein
VSLAIVLARQGKFDEARNAAEKAWPLFAPDDLPGQRQRFEDLLAALEGPQLKARKQLVE